MKRVSGCSYPKADISLFPCSYPGKAQCCSDGADKPSEFFAEDRDNICCLDHVKCLMQELSEKQKYRSGWQV